MSVYILNLFSILFYFILFRYAVKAIKSRKQYLCLIVALQLFLTAALRNTVVGGDLANYIPAFKEIGNLSWDELMAYPWEPGYVLLNRLIFFFSENERLLLVVISFLIVWGYIRFIWCYSKECWLSLFFFIAWGYYCGSLSMLRQSLAIICVLNSIQFVVNKDFKKFALWVLLGITFHTTAIVFILLYPLVRFKVTLKYFVLFLTVSFLFSIVAGKYLLFYVIEKYYSIYEGKIVINEGYGMLGLLVGITFLGVWIKERLKIDDPVSNIFYHMMIFACGLQLLSLQFSLFARVVFYFQIAMIVFIPEIISHLKGNEIKIAAKMLVVCFVTYYFTNIYIANNSSGIFPYHFFWESVN